MYEKMIVFFASCLRDKRSRHSENRYKLNKTELSRKGEGHTPLEVIAFTSFSES